MFTDHLFDELVRVAVVAPTRVYFNPIEALLAVALLVRIDLFVKVFFLQLEAEDVAPHPSSDVLCLCLHDVLCPGLPIFGVAVAPIALALSAQRGFDHGVIMYLRKITAAALQPFLIVIAVMSFESLTNMVLSIFGNASAGGLGVIPAAVAVSCSYMVFSAFVGETKHIAKEFIAH